MTPFTVLTGVAASLREQDVDTDIIFPARFLLLLDKAGLGRHLFSERRRAGAGDAQPFVLDRPPFDRAVILVAGANFGGGSSREQAVWALADFGIRCVIAPSFGEIFFANCFKNGVLPIALDVEPHEAAAAAAESGQSLSVDLERQVIALPDGRTLPFAVDPYRRRTLLLGLDEIGAILADDLDDIRRFEERQRGTAPWLHIGPAMQATFADLAGESTHE